MPRNYPLFGMLFLLIQSFTSSPTASSIRKDLVDLCCSIGKHEFHHSQCHLNSAHLGQLIDQSGIGRSTNDLNICRSVGTLCCGRQRQEKECLWGQEEALRTGSCRIVSHLHNKHLTTRGIRNAAKRWSSSNQQRCCNCCFLGTVQRSIDATKCFLPPQLSDSPSCLEAFVACCSKASLDVLKAIHVTFSNQHNPLSTSKYTNSHLSPTKNNLFTPTVFSDSPSVGVKKSYYTDIQGKGRSTVKDGHENGRDYSESRTQGNQEAGGAGYVGRGSSTSQNSLHLPDSTFSTFLNPASTVSHQSSTSPSLCQSGFAFNRMTMTCEDIDECVVDLHQCVEQAHCYNTIGSHVCKALDEDEEEEDEDEDYESEEGKNKEDGDIKVENEKMDGRKEESESTEDANEEGASGEKEGGNEEKKVEEKNYKKEENGGGVKLEPVESTDNSVEVDIGVFYSKHSATTTPTGNRSITKILLTTSKPKIAKIDRFDGPPEKKYKALTNSPRMQAIPTSLPSFGLPTTKAKINGNKGRNRNKYNKSTKNGYVSKKNNKNGAISLNNSNRWRHDIKCPVGYVFDVYFNSCKEIDECLLRPQVCRKNETCLNTLGSYRCVHKSLSCSHGYQPDSYHLRCVDVNECSHSHTNLCDHYSRSEGRNYLCQNLPGSYKCSEKQCSVGYALELDREQRKRQTTDTKGSFNDIEKYLCYPIECSVGFYFEPKKHDCVDINECEVWKDQICQRNMVCTNTIGSYLCEFAIKCHAGFENHPTTGECQDVDECGLRGNSLCDKSNSECINTQGSYHCRCKEGFQHDHNKANTCVDVNECEQRWACQHQCHNTWGSYRCSCNPGFMLNKDNRTCADVDECSLKSRLCHGFCVNTDGSYYCYCPEGYTRSKNGLFCQDVDECAQNSNTCGGSEDTVCVNTVGGHKCQQATCPQRFKQIFSSQLNNDNHVKCQRLQGHCRMSDVDCLKSPLSYSIHFIPIEHKFITIPLNIFKMGGPKSLNYKLNFRLNVTSSKEVNSGRLNTISDRFFYLKQKTSEGIVQMAKAIDEPTDIDMLLSMDLYDRNYRFRGTGVARILLYITKDPWQVSDNYMHSFHKVYNQHHPTLSELHPSRLLNRAGASESSRYRHFRRYRRNYRKHKRHAEWDGIEGTNKHTSGRTRRVKNVRLERGRHSHEGRHTRRQRKALTHRRHRRLRKKFKMKVHQLNEEELGESR